MPRKITIALAAACLVLSAARVSTQSDRSHAEMTSALVATADKWNNADIDGFMAPYAGNATYMTPDGLIGVERLRARYLAKYFTGSKPDQQLTFDQIEVRSLGADHALMTGRYLLRGGGKADQSGHFTLVWTRTSSGWRILHDHSS